MESVHFLFSFARAEYLLAPPQNVLRFKYWLSISVARQMEAIRLHRLLARRAKVKRYWQSKEKILFWYWTKLNTVFIYFKSKEISASACAWVVCVCVRERGRKRQHSSLRAIGYRSWEIFHKSSRSDLRFLVGYWDSNAAVRAPSLFSRMSYLLSCSW